MQQPWTLGDKRVIQTPNRLFLFSFLIRLLDCLIVTYSGLLGKKSILELKMKRRNRKVRSVTLEDALAGSVDDITVRYKGEADVPECFYQVKYHVDQRGVYSTTELVSHKPGESSLLEKFWRTWNLLRKENPERNIELHLISNWTWDSRDALKSCFDGQDGGIKINEIFSASIKSAIGRSRSIWQDTLKASDEEYRAFISCLRFKLGSESHKELEQRVAERMEYLNLKSDTSTLLLVVGIVRDWVKAGKQELTLDELENVLKLHELYLPSKQERCITIYLTTIERQKFELEPDYSIDWLNYFIGKPNNKGHQLVDPSTWNSVLLPELEQLKARVNQETDCRFVKARGLARLSAWFAFGHTFSHVARYTIEMEQQDKFWRTDATPSNDFDLLITSADASPDGEVIDGGGATVAAGISVTGLLDRDVKAYLANRTTKVSALLLLRPERELGRECLRSAGDVVALADEAKEYLRAFAGKWSASRLLLFYFGPISGACFLGHRLNAVCPQIQIMEDQRPGYAPSFLLEC